MQNVLLEQIIYEPVEKYPKGSIDQYASGTIALFTPFDPPRFSVPVMGSWAPSSPSESSFNRKPNLETTKDHVEPLGMSINQGSTKFFGAEVKDPLMRVDPYQGSLSNS